MSSMIYATVTGNKQGLISAGCGTAESIGNRYQMGHEDQIQVLSLKDSISREQNVCHQPIELIKPIDKATPLLRLGIIEDELFDIGIDILRTNPQGYNERFFEILLRNVTIVDISSYYPDSINNNSDIPFEKVLLKYSSITWSHKIASTVAYSFWEDRVY